MSTQEMTRFSESRGYALKWAFTPEMVFVPAEQEDGNGTTTWEKFAEPRGYALHWDGAALSQIETEEVLRLFSR